MFPKPHILFDIDERSGGQPAPDDVVDAPASPAASPAPQAAPAPASQPAVDWEKRYKGQQQYTQTLKTQLQTKEEQYAKAIAEYEAQITNLAGERDTVSGVKQSLEAEKSQLQQDNLTLKKQLAVVQMIHSPEHPELGVLAPFYAKGLLAVGDLEGEDLTNYLKEYASTLAGQLEGQVRTSVAGASPAQAAGARGAAGQTADELYAQLMSMPSTDPKYGELRQAYLEQYKREHPG